LANQLTQGGGDVQAFEGS